MSNTSNSIAADMSSVHESGFCYIIVCDAVFIVCDAVFEFGNPVKATNQPQLDANFEFRLF